MKEKTSIHKKISSKKVTFQDNPINKKLSSKEMNASNNSLTLKSIDNSLIEEDNSIDFDNNSYKERQLSILYEAFLMSYSKKTYKDLIKDIEEKEDLLYPKSKMSFEIKMIKLQSLLKLLLEEYNNYLKARNKTFHEIDVIINKIKHEFIIVYKILINNDSYEYEIITQIYCKFLYLLAKISIKKEDYLKSLGFVTLGINMLKIFFMKKIVATDIKTYKIYCKLILQLINILIGDKNYELAMMYCASLLKIIEISQKFIYNNDNNMKKKKNITPISKKFIIFGAITYLYIGCCLEQFDNNIQALEAYKQAIFFFNKGSRLGISFQNLNSVNINNSCSFCAEESYEKLKLKFENDKIELLNRQKKLEILKKKEEHELLQNEKLMKLKYISNGMIGEPFKFDRLEKKLTKKIFPSSVVNDLEKIDDELTSFVFTYFKNNKKDRISAYKDKMSYNTKKLMSRYEVYNILMSKKFRDFMMKTKNLEFYNPKRGSKSISVIQRYLNNKMKIESDSKTRNNNEKKTIKTVNNIESSNINLNAASTENIKTITTSPNTNKEEEKYREKILFKRNKNNIFRNHNSKYFLSLDSTNTKSSSNKKLYPSIQLNTTRSLINKNIKIKHKKIYNFNELECDFERKNLDKNLTTRNYLKKYFYYDKLSNKELNLQKLILKFKNNNTLYNEKRSVEEKNGIIGKDDIANISLIINENSKVKPQINEELVELNLLKDSFSSKENQISLKMKSAMSKVINKYIRERRRHQSTQKIINYQGIKELNEKNILQLDYSIKNINNNINHIKFLAGQRK